MGSLLKISASFLLISLNLAALGNDPFRSSVGAKDAGMGFVSLTRNGFWSSFRNQALLPENKSLSAGINYENRFSLKELGTKTIGLKVPTGRTSLGLIWSDFGYSGYRREFTGISCGMKLSNIISAGIQIDYIFERGSADNSAYHAVTYEGGMLLKPSETSGIGIHIINGVPGSLRKRFLPSVLSVGAGKTLSEVLFAGAEVEFRSGTDINFRTGFEYATTKNFWLRGGYSSNNNSFCFGLGYLAKIVQLDLAFVTHDKLGVSTSVSMVFKIK